MPHFTTGLSPAQLHTGRTPLLPEDLEFGPMPSTLPATTVPEYAAQLQNHLRKIHEIARNSTDFSTAVNKHRYDLRVKSLRLQPDEEVWFYNPRRRKGRCPKLQTNWEGPYIVMQCLNDAVIQIRCPRGKIKTVHVDRLRKFPLVASDVAPQRSPSPEKGFDEQICLKRPRSPSPLSFHKQRRAGKKRHRAYPHERRR